MERSNPTSGRSATQTAWYLERHPDVAMEGMNSLAHYLHWTGSLRVSTPDGPTL
jgi:hypothetical protein